MAVFVSRWKAVNQPKGTKNESNSQHDKATNCEQTSCKSTQRYKERKQFTTKFNKLTDIQGCKSTQRYKERKQFTTTAATDARSSTL